MDSVSRVFWGGCGSNWNERNYAPNTVPIEFRIKIKWKSTSAAHKLKTSIGIGGRVMTVGCLRKDDMRARVSLDATRVPKYTARSRFLKVIA